MDVEVGTRPCPQPMTPEGGGWWSARVADAAPGDTYAFRIDGGPPRPDPRSASQPDGVHGPSQLVDHEAFPWTDGGWRGVPLSGAVLYECHVGTFSAEGTFDGAIDPPPSPGRPRRGRHRAAAGRRVLRPAGVGLRRGGPVRPAPRLRRPGRPQTARRRRPRPGIGVVMDVVYNHLGPAGNYLPEFGPYFSARHQTNWGDAVNFDGPGSDEVRRFVIDNALMWLRDYHCDGLRLDAVHAIVDESAVHILEQLAGEVAALAAHVRRPLFLDRRVRPQRSPLRPQPRRRRLRLRRRLGRRVAPRPPRRPDRGDAPATTRTSGRWPLLAKALRQAWVYDGIYSPHRAAHPRAAPDRPARRAVRGVHPEPRPGRQPGRRRAPGRPDDARAGCGWPPAFLLTVTVRPHAVPGRGVGGVDAVPVFHRPRGRRPGPGGQRRPAARVRRLRLEPTRTCPIRRIPTSWARSRLDWAELGQEHHAQLLDWYRQLIALRRQLPALTDPRLDRVTTEFDDEEGWVVVRRGQVIVAANLGPHRATLPLCSSAEVLAVSDPAIHLAPDGLVLPPDTVGILRSW